MNDIIFIEKDSKVGVRVRLNGIPLTPERSLKVRNHSPDGFNIGYMGSGCAQLALAILLAKFDNVQTAQQLYQQFKFEHVAAWNFKSDNYGEEYKLATLTIELDIFAWAEKVMFDRLKSANANR